MEQYDIVIVGGGMAGLSAALYGGWLGHKVLLAERQMFGGQIVNADQVENYPGFSEGILGADLVSQVRTQALKFGAKMQYVEITAIEKHHEAFVLESNEDTYGAQSVIVATGGKPRHLGIKGEVELEGSGVSRCATCDGAFFADKPVAVIGGGDTALDEAFFLAGIASKVTIIHQTEQPTASAALVTRARGNNKIEWISRASVTEIIGSESVEGLRLSQGEAIVTAAVFIAIGFEPETALLTSLIEIDPMGHAPVDLHMQTSMPGLFAVGSARQGSSGQISSVTGDGVTAAIFSHRYISTR
ncbi:MAG TPA: FAD-dependent oxidoreductase [Candidatus Binatia bacterium]